MDESGASIECKITNGCDTVWDREIRETGAEIKSIITNGRHTAVGGNHTGFAAGNKCFTLTFNETIAVAVVNGVVFGYSNRREPGAAGECFLTNRRHTAGDSDTCEAAATGECGFSDGCYTVGNGDRRESTATGECGFANSGYTAIMRNYATFATLY